MNQQKRSWPGGLEGREMVVENWLNHLSLPQKLLLFVPTVLVFTYVFLGFIRCAAVVALRDPGIAYEPWLDWWWSWLF